MRSQIDGTAACPRCGYRYESPAAAARRRERASLVMLLRHWARVHGAAPDRLLDELRSVITREQAPG